eukprot:61314_1
MSTDNLKSSNLDCIELVITGFAREEYSEIPYDIATLICMFAHLMDTWNKQLTNKHINISIFNVIKQMKGWNNNDWYHTYGNNIIQWTHKATWTIKIRTYIQCSKAIIGIINNSFITSNNTQCFTNSCNGYGFAMHDGKIYNNESDKHKYKMDLCKQFNHNGLLKATKYIMIKIRLDLTDIKKGKLSFDIAYGYGNNNKVKKSEWSVKTNIKYTNNKYRLCIGLLNSADEYSLIPNNRNYNIINKECGYCSKVGVGLLVCSRCRNVYYCNINCQRPHWTYHKKNCKKRT